MTEDPQRHLLASVEALMAEVRLMRLDMARISERLPQVSDAAMRVRKFRRNSDRNREETLPSVDERNRPRNSESSVSLLEALQDQDQEKKETAKRNRETENEVFLSYKQALGKRNSILDDRRRKLIGKALENFKPEDLARAFKGCAATPFNMGQNDNGKRYDSLGLILRDADHIERFMASAPSTGRAPDAAKTRAGIVKLDSVVPEAPSPEVQAKLKALMKGIGT